MAKFRVKAYFMHEHEEAAAHQAVNDTVIEGAEWTPGYVMGVVDQRDIEELSKQGLVVSLVEEVAQPKPAAPSRRAGARAGRRRGPAGAEAAPEGAFPINAPLTVRAGKSRPLPATAARQDPEDKILSCDFERAQFYVVRFHGPITEARGKELSKARIKLLERLSRNKYTVRLEPAEVSRLAALPFVDTIRLYTAEDTLRGELPPAAPAPPKRATSRRAGARRAAKPAAAAPRTSMYNVRLHRAKDMPAVVEWLAGNKHKPLWKGKDMLRLALADGSQTLRGLASLPEVAVVERMEPPRLFDSHARTLLRLEEKNKPPFGLEGAGEIIGVADTGIDETHDDLKARIAGVSAWGRTNDASDPEGHGTHVAGCAAGDGTASGGEVRGAAPQAKIFFQSILDANGGLGGLPPDLGKLFDEAYKKGARIHNNSWGAFSFARYSTTSLDVDRFVAAHPDMLIVIAAGNDGMGVPRVSGGVMAADRGFVDWPCVAAPATAKNGLTVGASRSSRTAGGLATLTWGDAWSDRYPHPPIAKEKISGKDECLAAFSSRGPSDDQRIKPDVVAPGTDIAAARSKDAPLHKFWGAYPHNSKYGFMGGTSMAAPYVAGCAALVRQWYRTQGGWATPSAALLKATLINGARRIKGKDAEAPLPGDPNYHQGFGRIDMASTVPNPISPKLKLVFDDTWQDAGRVLHQTGERFRYRVKVGAGLPLRICLAWTDPPARGLQNSLVLLVDRTSQNKWIGNEQAATLLRISGAFPDPNNNVQVVRIAEPEPGEYTIAVFAGMLLVPPQSFALVVTGDLKSGLDRI